MIHVKRRKNIFIVKKEIDTQIFVYKKTRQQVFFWRLKKCLCQPTESLRTACQPKNLSRLAKICRPASGLNRH